MTVHGKCSAISDGDWQVFPIFFNQNSLTAKSVPAGTKLVLFGGTYSIST